MLARIYKIINTKTNKVYIGFTSQRYLLSRFNRHKFNAKQHNSRYNSKLYNSINKHGIEHFKIEEIYCSKDKEHTLKIMEQYFIKEYDSYNKGYNCSLGGEGRLAARHSKETIHKMSIIKLGKKHSIENKNKISIGNARTYRLTSINGNAYYVTNLSQWCKSKHINNVTLLGHGKLLKYGIAKVEKLPRVN